MWMRISLERKQLVMTSHKSALWRDFPPPSVSTYTSGHLFMKFCSWNLHEMWNPSCPAGCRRAHHPYRPSWAELQQHSWPGQQWLWLGGADRAAAAVWGLTSSAEAHCPPTSKTSGPWIFSMCFQRRFHTTGNGEAKWSWEGHRTRSVVAVAVDILVLFGPVSPVNQENCLV